MTRGMINVLAMGAGECLALPTSYFSNPFLLRVAFWSNFQLTGSSSEICDSCPFSGISSLDMLKFRVKEMSDYILLSTFLMPKLPISLSSSK